MKKLRSKSWRWSGVRADGLKWGREGLLVLFVKQLVMTREATPRCVCLSNCYFQAKQVSRSSDNQHQTLLLEKITGCLNGSAKSGARCIKFNQFYVYFHLNFDQRWNILESLYIRGLLIRKINTKNTKNMTDEWPFILPVAFWTTEEKLVYCKCHTSTEPYQYGRNLCFTIKGCFCFLISSD